MSHSGIRGRVIAAVVALVLSSNKHGYGARAATGYRPDPAWAACLPSALFSEHPECRKPCRYEGKGGD